MSEEDPAVMGPTTQDALSSLGREAGQEQAEASLSSGSVTQIGLSAVSPVFSIVKR